MDRPERKVAPSIASSPTVGVPFGVETGGPTMIDGCGELVGDPGQQLVMEPAPARALTGTPVTSRSVPDLRTAAQAPVLDLHDPEALNAMVATHHDARAAGTVFRMITQLPDMRADRVRERLSEQETH